MAGLPGDHMRAGFGLPKGACLFELPQLSLECGEVLAPCHIAYTTYGELNAARDNTVLVGHSLTSNSNVAEWWAPMLGAGESYALDTSRHFVICPNFLGSPYGSTSPVTIVGGEEGKPPLGANFPAPVTLRDNVAAQRLLLKSLGIERCKAVVGGSMGAMLALEWACCHPDKVGQLIMIAGCGRHTDWQIGMQEAHRQAIYSDTKWQGGQYTGKGEDAPNQGLATARMMAMLSYRAPASVAERFNRGLQEEAGAGGASGGAQERPTAAGMVRSESQQSLPFFQVQSYLQHQGKKFIERFDARCYVSLSHTLDSHDVGRGRKLGYFDVLASLPHRALVVGIDSDVLYPLELQAEVAEHMPHGILHVIHSPHGHDSFLIEIDALNKTCCDFLRGEGSALEAEQLLDSPLQRKASVETALKPMNAKGSVESLAHRVWELERQLAAALEMAEAEREEVSTLRERLAAKGGGAAAEQAASARRARQAWGMVAPARSGAMPANPPPSRRLLADLPGPIFGKLPERSAHGAGFA